MIVLVIVRPARSSVAFGAIVIGPLPNGPLVPSSLDEEPAMSAPARIVVPPVYVFAPDSVSPPWPYFASEPSPEIAPE